MKRILWILIASVLLFSACQRQNIEKEGQEETDLKVNWESLLDEEESEVLNTLKEKGMDAELIEDRTTKGYRTKQYLTEAEMFGRVFNEIGLTFIEKDETFCLSQYILRWNIDGVPTAEDKTVIYDIFEFYIDTFGDPINDSYEGWEDMDDFYNQVKNRGTSFTLSWGYLDMENMEISTLEIVDKPFDITVHISEEEGGSYLYISSNSENLMEYDLYKAYVK